MAVTLTLRFPPELERSLRQDIPDLEADALEAYTVELYRRGNLSKQQLAEVLRLDRLQAEAALKRHGVFEGSLTAEDVDSDRRALDGVLGKPR
jgi:predicted HTH domain antitoxin